MNLSKLDKTLRRVLGDDWYNLEVETISMEIGIQLDMQTVVKIAVLKALESNVDSVLENCDYMLRFIEVANGNLPDPHHHDIPSSLEFVWAIHELNEILGESNVVVNACLANTARYILMEEGHGEAFHKCLSKFSGYPLETNDKTKACDEYIQAMIKGDK